MINRDVLVGASDPDDEWRERLAERVAKLKMSQSKLDAARAELKRRRDAGLRARHAAKPPLRLRSEDAA